MRRLILGSARAIDWLNAGLSRLASWLTIVMVATTLVVVLLRYALGIGWIALQELVVYLFAAVIMLCIADTLRGDGHVRIDVFTRAWSRRRRAWVDLLGNLLFLLPFSAFLGWASWDYVALSWSVWEGSRAAGGLPGLFLIKGLIPLAAALTFLQGLALIARNLCLLSALNAVPEQT